MTEEKLFDFEEFSNDMPAITCLQQSPIVDVVAVGFQNGDIKLVNILYNEVVLEFSQSSDGGPIKSMSFSSDIGMGISLLASVSESRNGGQNIVFWDLNNKKIYSTLNGPHSEKQVSCISFMQNEPVLITSSAEGNSIKMWLFEKGLIVPRLLR
jgi:U3 small nucleolar RNA-associated protein 21